MRTIILASFMAGVVTLSGCGSESPTLEKQTAAPVQNTPSAPAATPHPYQAMRNQALALTADPLKAPAGTEVLAAIMDMGTADGFATIIGVMDGSTSVCYEQGEAVLGMGQYPEPRAAALNFVATAAQFKAACASVKEYPLPTDGFYRIYVVTPQGILMAEAHAQDIYKESHPAYGLFKAGGELMTQIRLKEQELEVKAAATGAGPAQP